MLCPFLEDHKEDILCGPVWLASGLDLSGHAGMLSLTSPKLVKGDPASFWALPRSFTPAADWLVCAGMAGGKYRSFLVHMKATCDRSLDDSARPVLRMPSSRPQASKAHSLSNLLQRAQAPKVPACLRRRGLAES